MDTGKQTAGGVMQQVAVAVNRGVVARERGGTPFR